MKRYSIMSAKTTPRMAMDLRRALGSALHLVLRNQLSSTRAIPRDARLSSGSVDSHQKSETSPEAIRNR